MCNSTVSLLEIVTRLSSYLTLVLEHTLNELVFMN